jgi:phage FluMu protein Com
MAVSFKCPHCGKLLRTASAPAPGKKIKCPACTEPFLPKINGAAASTAIQKKPAVKAPPPPDDDDDEDEDRPAKARKAAPPLKAKRRPDDDDEDDDRPRKRGRDDDDDEDDDDRPRGRRDDEEDDDERARKKKKKGKAQKSKLPLILGLVGGVLVLLIGVVAVVMLMRPGSTKGPTAGKAPGVDPMAFIPPGDNMVFGMNVGAVQRTGKLEDLLGLMDKANEVVKEDAGEVAEQKQLFRDAERMLSSGKGGDNGVLVVQTREAVDQERVKKAYGAEAAREVAGIKVYKLRPAKLKPNGTRWAAFPDPRIVLLSEQKEKDFDAQLEASKKPAPHPAADLMRDVNASHLWLVVLFDQNTKQQMSKQLPQMAKMSPKLGALVPPVLQARGVLGKADWVDPGALKVQVGLACGSDGDAGKIKGAIDEFWAGEGQQMMAMAPLMLGGALANGPKGKGAAPAGPDINKLVDEFKQSFSVQQEGAVAWASLQISEAALKPPAAGDKKK